MGELMIYDVVGDPAWVKAQKTAYVNRYCARNGQMNECDGFPAFIVVGVALECIIIIIIGVL